MNESKCANANVFKSMMAFLALGLVSCTSVPEGITPVSQFEVNRYLGHWYEIARFDHRFERGLSNVTATYSQNADGSISVTNRGYNVNKQLWEQAEGKAKFVSSSNVGHLKVSFFGPFYASYVVIKLDQQDYGFSLVTGPDRSYLWILSRTPELPETIFEQLTAHAFLLGYATEKLIRVDQSIHTE